MKKAMIIILMIILSISVFADVIQFDEDIKELNSEIGNCGRMFKYKHIGFYNKDDGNSYTFVINESGYFDKVYEGTSDADFTVKASEIKLRKNKDKIKPYNYFLYAQIPLRVQCHALRVYFKCRG